MIENVIDFVSFGSVVVEIKSVAALLGMSSVTLYQGLTTVSRLVRGQVFRTAADAFTVSKTLKTTN